MTNLLLLLACLSQFESGDDDGKIGRAGERGRYQIKAESWREISLAPFRWASVQDWSDHVAELLLRKRVQAFYNLFHRDPSIREIYILWNAPAQIGKPSKRVKDRAKRFENLYNSMKEKQK